MLQRYVPLFEKPNSRNLLVMKTTLILFFIFFISKVYSQDTVSINQIDSLVLEINTSNVPIQCDTLKNDQPEMGLKMTTFFTIMVNGNQIKKLVNHVDIIMTEKTETRNVTTSNAFYYDQNKLIKVEEYFLEGGTKKTAEWYYSQEKPIYNTLQPDNANDRANLLLTISNGLLNQIIK